MDDFLAIYVTESTRHLETVEDDLLTMERRAASAPSELVDRVFRAAHSIKGGAGFFELSGVKELASKLENVLEMVRSDRLVPNSEVVGQLLQGFDKLKLVFADIGSAADVDMADEILALSGLASAYLPSEKKEQAVVMVRYPVPGSRLTLQAGELLVDSYRSAGNGIALLLFDLIHDVQRVGKLPNDLLAQIDGQGVLLDCGIDIFGVGTLDAETVADRVPFYVLLSTSKSAGTLAATLGIAADRIRFVETPSEAPAKPRTTPSGPAPQETEAVVRLVYELTGITIDPQPERIGRLLGGLLGTRGCGTYSELAYKARLDSELKDAVIDRVTDHETRFFRGAAFDELRSVAQNRTHTPLRIWSAACSTGQETYSIAMLLDEVLGSAPFEIVGSDISAAAVARAAAGEYAADEIALGLSAERRDRYFIQTGGVFRAGDRLRSLVTFRRLNLHEDFADQGPWDAVFCGRVAERFSEAARTSLFRRLHAVLQPDGVLFLDPDEPAGGVCPPFSAARPGVFSAKSAGV
jgi:chemotaxis methyl-accepting protein methylase/HPt (histidine-containing phosphotransfer) domain-containing protein